VVDSLKVLDPEWPIREADIVAGNACSSFGNAFFSSLFQFASRRGVRSWNIVPPLSQVSSPLPHNIARRVRELNEALEQFAARKVKARRQSDLDAHFCC
jgi:hypothetical protein